MKVAIPPWRRRARSLGGSLLVVLGGCGPAQPDEAELELMTHEEAIRIPNSLTTQALVLNALATNPEANGMLATNGLRPLFDPVGGSDYIREQLRDVDAQRFMEYVVTCALEEGQGVEWKDPMTGSVSLWKGKLGLCSEWGDDPPSPECLNRVSACVIARNNAFGMRVELSMRGEDPSRPDAFELEPATLPTRYDPDTSGLVGSFAGCSSPAEGVTRNCGWSVDFIGRCAPGTQVRLGAGGVPPDQCESGPALGSSEGSRMMLRVCSGIAGCDQGGPRFQASSAESCNGEEEPAVSFTCPPEGYFNVMKAPWDSQQSGTVTVEVEAGTPAGASYPSSELEAFTIREGAFYGTIFDPDALGATVRAWSTGT